MADPAGYPDRPPTAAQAKKAVVDMLSPSLGEEQAQKVLDRLIADPQPGVFARQRARLDAALHYADQLAAALDSACFAVAPGPGEAHPGPPHLVEMRHTLACYRAWRANRGADVGPVLPRDPSG